MQTLTKKAIDEKLPTWGVAVFESHHAPEFEMEWRTHRFLKLIYVYAGEGWLHSASESAKFSAGDLLVVPAGRKNRLSDVPDKPVSVYVLCLASKILAFDPRIERRLRCGRRPLSPELANRAESLFRGLLYQQRSGGERASLSMATDALGLVGVATEAGGEAERNASDDRGDDPPMARYVEHLDNHFFDAEGIDSAAARLGLSRRAFTERFRAATGQSWLAYVRRRAIDHACRLLVETDKPIALVAFECGFGDLSSFYRRFKAVTGASPAAWRRENAVGKTANQRMDSDKLSA